MLVRQSAVGESVGETVGEIVTTLFPSAIVISTNITTSNSSGDKFFIH
jgi:hypothetical protein